MIIAEIGQAHDGSLGMAHSFIDALKDSSVDAIKFQTHIAHAESSQFEEFRVNFSYEDSDRYGYWKRMEFTPEQWFNLKLHCEDVGLDFLSSPFSIAAVELLEKLNVSRYKIGSGEIRNYLMLSKISQTKKPIILSTGLVNLAELDETVGFIEKEQGIIHSILQCTTAYPTTPDIWGLNVIDELKMRYNYSIGFSDHSGDIFALIAAAALGAQVFEFHVTFDQKMFGPDSKASLPISEVSKLVQGIKNVQLALSSNVNKAGFQNSELQTLFGKSLAIRKNKSSGEKIKFEDLESKKPWGKGVDAKDYNQLIGSVLLEDLKEGDFIKQSNVKKV